MYDYYCWLKKFDFGLMQVLNHLSLIDANDHSEVESYLRRMLRGTGGAANSTENSADSVSATNTRNNTAEHHVCSIVVLILL